MGKLIRAISENGGVFICAVDSTDIVSEMEKIHKTSGTASAALGRVLTAAALMGSMLKSDGDTLTLRVLGNGPIGSIIVVSDHLGNVRGTCDHPEADVPLNQATGKLDVAGVVGSEGILAVIRDYGLKEPYVGQVPLVSGEIAEDITNYFAVSEQTPTASALGVLVNADLSIKAAGGFIMQLLPGASEEEIDRLERNIAALPPISAQIERGMDISEIAAAAMDGFSPQILDEYEVAYRCRCSEERMKQALLSLGRNEIESLAEEGEDIEIVCSFCNKKYSFSPEQLLGFLEE